MERRWSIVSCVWMYGTHPIRASNRYMTKQHTQNQTRTEADGDEEVDGEARGARVVLGEEARERLLCKLRVLGG